MIGTSGSEARLIVESGDFRVLVEEVERLTEESVDPARVGGNELLKIPSADGEGVVVDDELAERYEGEYWIWGMKLDGEARAPVDEYRRLGG